MRVLLSELTLFQSPPISFLLHLPHLLSLPPLTSLSMVVASLYVVASLSPLLSLYIVASLNGGGGLAGIGEKTRVTCPKRK